MSLHYYEKSIVDVVIFAKVITITLTAYFMNTQLFRINFFSCNIYDHHIFLYFLWETTRTLRSHFEHINFSLLILHIFTLSKCFVILKDIAWLRQIGLFFTKWQRRKTNSMLQFGVAKYSVLHICLVTCFISLISQNVLNTMT